MKMNDFNSLGVKEMTKQETISTNGGSLTVILICAAAALLLSSCDLHQGVDPTTDYLRREIQSHNNDE